MITLNKKKILFISLEYLGLRKCYHPIHFTPPIALKYAKRLLDEDSEYDIEIIDSYIDRLSLDKLILKTMIQSPKAIIVCISSFSYIKTWEFASKIKTQNKKIIIIGIGHDVTFRSQEYLSKNSPFDIIINGEVEQELPNAIRNLSLTNGKRFIYRSNLNTNIYSNLNRLPFPNFTSEELKKYRFIYPVKLNKRVVCGYVLTSRGCKHNCIFCTQTVRRSYSNILRFRNTRKVLDEIEDLMKKGVNLIYFIDDNFSSSRQHVLSICEEIIRRNLKISWVASARIDELDYTMLKIMKKAGCILLLLSVESGSERIIKLLNKTQEENSWLDKAKSIFRYSRQLGIGTCALFIIGSPSETKGEIEKSLNFAKNIDPDFIKVHFFTPYPGSAIYETVKERIPLEKLSIMHHYLSPVVNLSGMDMGTLKKMQAYFYKKFIFRPPYIFNHLSKYFVFYLFNLNVFILFFNAVIRICWLNLHKKSRD